ncbi:C2 domain-containing protein 2 [Eufriesea mexicana]|uniref:C2 domain-containing protein 2 n=1 Tax=Eufriesea mexicana TaxID=516756 RepID=A0A310STN4_9HYME|nr:C2 domain-containing protein 2 [Eufriesea mexicana]
MFLESNWTWLAERWGNMADLAERVDDLICSFDSAGDTTMDTLSMLIFGWMLFGLVVLCVGKYVYNRFVLNELASGTIVTAKDGHIVHGDSVGVSGGAAAGGGGGSGGTGGGGGAGGAGGGSSGKLLSLGKQKIVSSASGSSGTGAGGGGGGAGSGSPVAVNHPSSGGASPISGSSPTSYVPPTPPVRKRLTARKTSGGLISPARSSRSLHLQTATGADPDAVRWVNEIIVWLYSDPAILDELLAVWVGSLNQFTTNSVDEHGVGVEFVRVLPETHPPNLSNIFCECDSKDDVTITCDCEATPALQLKAFRRKADKLEVSHYRVNVNRFRARLNVICITEKLLLDLKCDGWPDVKVSLAQVGTIKKDLDESQLQEVVTEIVIGALRGTNVHLNLFQYPSCPRLWREPATTQPSFSMPMHYDNVNTTGSSLQVSRQRLQTQSPTQTQNQYVASDRRLLVKVVKAAELGGEQGAVEPYCVVELDDPPQKNQTSVKKDTRNPLWDEAFLFDVNRNTSEVLIEVYDRVNKSQRFLGLGIVGIDELLANPSQRQIIPLQNRPYEEEDITGTLTVEFLFIEGAEVPQIGSKPYKVKETIKPVSPTPRTYTPTNLISDNSLNYNNGNSTLILYDSTVQPDGDYLTNGNVVDSPYRTGQSNGNKGTLIVHSQQRHGAKDTSLTSGPESTPNSSNSEERGRTRRKRRDFFGTIKKRLSRSKTRSRSVGPEGDANHEDPHSRSISADRARDPGSGREEQSRRSSLSEASGISGASTRTYVNEASTLVLETLENGIKKHYLVPLSLAQKSKWRKKGTKLHIFNDHTFIAKHMAGGTVCEVCKRTLARRLGKQGYECRDCQMKCHKHCHVKVDTTCPTSTIQSIELTCIKVPRPERRSTSRLC